MYTLIHHQKHPNRVPTPVGYQMFPVESRATLLKPVAPAVTARRLFYFLGPNPSNPRPPPTPIPGRHGSPPPLLHPPPPPCPPHKRQVPQSSRLKNYNKAKT